MEQAVQIGLVGYGKMGHAIFEAAQARDDAKITFVFSRHLQADMKEAAADMMAVFSHPQTDVVIDFTHASAFGDVVACALAQRKPLMTGTTGLSPQDQDALFQASRQIPILHATNTSLSLVVMQHVVTETAALLARRGYDCHIHEVHHRMKKDAPSGTAKSLGAAVAEGSGGLIAPAYSSARGGTVISFHDVTFYGPSQTLGFQHHVDSRAVYADGAIDAAVWLRGKPPGLYGMQHVAGLVEV